MEDIKQLILPEVWHKFGIAVPRVVVGEGVNEVYLDNYERLCKEKYDAYVEYYPEQNATLMEVMGSIGGKFGGVARRFQCDRILEVLHSSRREFPDGYQRFSVTTYEELSRAIFGVSPTRDALLELVADNTANGRITTTGQKVAEATRFLVSEYPHMAQMARDYVEQSRKNYKLAIMPIKSKYDKKIMKLKKG